MSIEDAIRTACLMECTAPKPGNVHPAAAFDDLCYHDFVRSAEIVAPIIAKSESRGVGRAIRDAVAATQQAIGKNTNLGIVLLLAPLAAVPRDVSLNDGISSVLRSLSREDAELAYDAIRLCNPGGLGRVDDGDVTSSPTGTLVEMMRLSAGRDAVAAQYATDFEFVLQTGLSLLQDIRDWFPGDWQRAVVRLHLEFLARQPDTLIARKCGPEIAAESQGRAKAVLDAGWPHGPRAEEQLAEFDRWLRSDGHARNPGTTADLVAATLFAALREDVISPPEIAKFSIKG